MAIFGLLGFGFLLFLTGTLPPYEAPAEWHEAARDRGARSAAHPAGVRLGLGGADGHRGRLERGARPSSRRRRATPRCVLILMGAVFASIFLGISFLASQLGILPDPTEQETVISQLTRTLVGEGTPFHYLVQVSTALLLVLAANTAFADFPRMASILARDRFLPRLFAFRGDRLAFTSGIVVLAVIAAVLIVAFEGSVTNLIPLYTVGVFVAFTLSQTGMVRHWWKLRDEVRGWRWRAAINGLGASPPGSSPSRSALEVRARRLDGALIIIPVSDRDDVGDPPALRRDGRRASPETPLTRPTSSPGRRPDRRGQRASPPGDRVRAGR